MRNSVAIIDFGSSKITTLVGEMGVNNKLNILGKGEVSYAGFQNSELLEPENLKEQVGNSILRAENETGTKIYEVYVGVPGEFTAAVSKTVPFSFLRPKKIDSFDINSIFRTGSTFEKEANYYLINKSVLYYELDDSRRVIDPVGMRSKTLIGNVSYILAVKSFIDEIKNVFKKLKIVIKGFISSMLSESLYLFNDEERNNYVALIDIGYITTSVAIAQGNGLIFLNSFSLGGGYVSSDLSQCLRIPFSEAEALKDKIALAWEPSKQDNYIVNIDGLTKNYSAKATNEIAFDRIEVICKYIKRCFDSSGYKIPENTSYYLTGGGVTNIKGIRNVISQKLKKSVISKEVVNGHKVLPYNASSESLLYFVLTNSENLDKIIIKV